MLQQTIRRSPAASRGSTRPWISIWFDFNKPDGTRGRRDHRFLRDDVSPDCSAEDDAELEELLGSVAVVVRSKLRLLGPHSYFRPINWKNAFAPQPVARQVGRT